MSKKFNHGWHGWAFEDKDGNFRDVVMHHDKPTCGICRPRNARDKHIPSNPWVRLRGKWVRIKMVRTENK